MTDITQWISAAEARCEAATPLVEIPDFAGYCADTDGNIWSLDSNWRGYGARRLAAHIDRHGYLTVRLTVNGKRIKRKVHRLVALAFHGIPKPKQEVRHLDGNRLNNAKENLQWGTRVENAADRDLHNTTARGSRNGFSKIDESIAFKIKKSAERTRVLASLYGISTTLVIRIKNGSAWRHV